jgi:uncharacterized repeat protein (TIGR03803 family)
MLTSNESHRWISRIRLQSPCARLALAITLVSAFLVTLPMHARNYGILHAFKRQADGGDPQAGLLLSAKGDLYGTTFLGGDPACSCGTVFEVFPDGGFTVLYQFKGNDGANPSAGLVADGDGNLYGTTSQGGRGPSGKGTVFKLTPPTAQRGHWTETVLHTFTGESDGASPYGSLVLDKAGNLYGTTSRGGVSNDGTVFMVDATSKESVLYSFTGSPDGAYPYGWLVRDDSGNLYGTTFEGGDSNYGTVFKLETTGAESVLHSFARGADGAYPNAGLTLDASGNLYGTTNAGGDKTDDGVIFKVDSNTGAFRLLHTFAGTTNGSSPNAGLIVDDSGNLYGTTTEGGDRDYNGTIFKLDTGGGAFTVLFTFGGKAGSYPYAGLVRDSASNLYGTTEGAGAQSNGVVFKLNLK